MSCFSSHASLAVQIQERLHTGRHASTSAECTQALHPKGLQVYDPSRLVRSKISQKQPGAPVPVVHMPCLCSNQACG